MSDQPNPTASLESVRRKIDEIDAQLLDLLRERFAISHKVREVKAASGQDKSSPIRPSRETIVIRQLIDSCEEPLPVNLMVRLWRQIMTSSTLVQANARVHCNSQIMQEIDLRDMIRDHFCLIPIIEHDSDEEALKAALQDRTSIAVVSPEGTSAQVLSDGDIQEAAVIGTMPAFDADGVPQLLIVGQPFGEPTGQDETLVLSSGRLPRDFTPSALWEVELGSGDVLTSLPGFLSGSHIPLLDLKQNSDTLALRVLGRYPSPISI